MATVKTIMPAPSFVDGVTAAAIGAITGAVVVIGGRSDRGYSNRAACARHAWLVVEV